MSSTFKNNAYHILGLDTSSSEKDILKRSKEIINRLKIDDAPNYELDIGVFESFRTEDTVKDALQRLQASRKRIKEYFFWFQIADSVDEQVLGLFKLKDYSNAIRTWQNVSEGQSTKAFFYKKNLAILYCLMLSSEDNKDYLRSSLVAWSELIDSDKFWSSFSKVYKLHDEQTASQDIISDFKSHVVGYLSDIYTDLHHIHKDSDYINEFQKVFSAKGEKIEKSILRPAYQAINQAVEKLEKLEVSKDGKFDKIESESIKGLVATIQEELNKLIDLGLYDDSQTQIMRDRSANALRSIVVDLHNMEELDKSHGLLEVAIQLAGTESLKNRLSSELEQIQRNIAGEADNSLAVEIPGTSNTIIFKNSFLDYCNKIIFYKDITGMSYHSCKNTTSIYGVPVSTSYTYSLLVISTTDRISLSLSASSDNSKQKDAWIKSVSLLGHLAEPIIVKGLVEQIFDKGEVVKIGGIEFTKQGYSRSKFFGGKETILWTETVYVPKFDSGNVILWKDKKGTSRQFSTVEMSTINAVVIPELIKACVNYPK